MPVDEDTQLSKGYAFVEFNSPEVNISSLLTTCTPGPIQPHRVPTTSVLAVVELKASGMLCCRKRTRCGRL